MDEDSYDYVIVGAGSAGCVLAERLTASGRHTVLLIEAGGGDRRFWIRTPLGYARTFRDPSVNWCYQTEEDDGLGGRRGYWPRGRVVGGCSSINAMVWLRGLPEDFDGWEAAGALGWNWRSALRAYEAIEARDDDASPCAAVRLSDLGEDRHPFTRHFLAAARQMGWPASASAGGNSGEGLSTLVSTRRRGRRWSAADAFLAPALKRPNLRLVTRALVERLSVAGGRARGVVYRRRGRRRVARAGREVIVSAGAINSPQLLQLSGIGPAGTLRAHGI